MEKVNFDLRCFGLEEKERAEDVGVEELAARMEEYRELRCPKNKKRTTLEKECEELETKCSKLETEVHVEAAKS